MYIIMSKNIDKFEILTKNIKSVRQYFNLSIARFAAEIDVPAMTLTSYERGERTPSAKFFVQLHKKGINLNWLVSGVGNMFVNDNSLLKQDNSNIIKNLDSFYKRFNYLQQKNGLNDFQMSKITDISESRIEKLGIGKAQPTLEELNKIKSVFDVSIDWLLYDEFSNNSESTQNDETNLSANEIKILKKLVQKASSDIF